MKNKFVVKRIIGLIIILSILITLIMFFGEDKSKIRTRNIINGGWGIKEIYMDTTYLKSQDIVLDDDFVFGLQLVLGQPKSYFYLQNANDIISTGRYEVIDRDSINIVRLYNSEGKNIDGDYKVSIREQRTTVFQQIFYITLESHNIIIMGERTVNEL